MHTHLIIGIVGAVALLLFAFLVGSMIRAGMNDLS